MTGACFSILLNQREISYVGCSNWQANTLAKVHTHASRRPELGGAELLQQPLTTCWYTTHFLVETRGCASPVSTGEGAARGWPRKGFLGASATLPSPRWAEQGANSVHITGAVRKPMKAAQTGPIQVKLLAQRLTLLNVLSVSFLFYSLNSLLFKPPFFNSWIYMRNP